MGLFGGGLSNFASGLVSTAVSGATSILAGGTSTIKTALEGIAPIVSTVANSAVGVGIANKIGGGATSPEAIAAASGGGTAKYAAKGATGAKTGLARFFCYYKMDADGNVLQPKELDTKKVVIHSIAFLTVGVIVYKIGKAKRWW